MQVWKYAKLFTNFVHPFSRNRLDSCLNQRTTQAKPTEANRQSCGLHNPPGMRKLTKNWLEPYPWASVLDYVTRLRNCPPETLRGPGYDETFALWEKMRARQMPLHEALRVCRLCHELSPFEDDDSGSFIHIAKAMVLPLTANLSPTLAAAAGAVIEDYVAGVSDDVELGHMLDLVHAKMPGAAEIGQSPSLLD
jgi:hypothetical protein